jgi:hypothetical protein
MTTTTTTITTPALTPSQSLADTIIQQTSTITIYGHTFNVYAGILLTLFGLLLYGFYKVQTDKNNAFDWTDMLTGVNQSTGKREASTSKILQLVGAITATFIVVKLTIQNALTFDIFGTYLAYVSATDAFTRFMLAKYGVKPDPAGVAAATTSGIAPKPKDDDQ